jgi:hypothetical protein
MANFAVAIFRMNTNGNRGSCLVVGIEWEVTDATGGAEKQSASQRNMD